MHFAKFSPLFNIAGTPPCVFVLDEASQPEWFRAQDDQATIRERYALVHLVDTHASIIVNLDPEYRPHVLRAPITHLEYWSSKKQLTHLSFYRLQLVL